MAGGCGIVLRTAYNRDWVMRTMFFTYLVFLIAVTAFFIVIGLTHS
jgi:hypothetical protein